MLQVPTSPIPFISISFAPNELSPVEPKSPFAPTLHEEPDVPRPQYLLPPSPLSPSQALRAHGQLSPLSSSSSDTGRGLKRDQFEAMLRASRERSAMVGARKPVELRKEIAIKAQKAKQCERRARFLSKLVAPPSPTAASMPVTPPESPAIFHFSLPSPGMVSPLELFEDIANHPELYDTKATIEQVDFRLPQQKHAAESTRSYHTISASIVPAKPPPSLEQISKRLGRSSNASTITRLPSPERSSTASRLPSFLRLRTPTLSSALQKHSPTVSSSSDDDAEECTCSTYHPTPNPPRPKLQVTTTVCPPTQSKSSPTKFTEANITQFGTAHTAVVKRAETPAVIDKTQIRTQRVKASRDLFVKLSRRTSQLPGAATCGVRAQDDTSPVLLPPGPDDKFKRRWTAPAEMCFARMGERHPVLDRPGGF